MDRWHFGRFVMLWSGWLWAASTLSVRAAEPLIAEPLAARRLAEGSKASWSPDGRKLVFAKLPYGAGLQVLDFQSSTVTDLLDSGKDPAWSPGRGEWIAYVCGNNSDEEVWVVKASGEEARKVADGGFPSWSLDGKTLYFRSKERGIVSLDVSQAKGDPQVHASPAFSWYPVVSLDGRRMAYFHGGDLVIGSCPTGAEVRRQPLPGWRGVLAGWSPDGRRLAYGGYGMGFDDQGLWIFDVDSGQRWRVAEGPVTMPAWSRDGSQLAFDIRRPGRMEIWLIDAKQLDKLAPFLDLYTVPVAGDVDELVAFLGQLRDYRPRTFGEFCTHREKSGEALQAAAERIIQLESDPSSRRYRLASEMLLHHHIAQLGAADADQKRRVLAEVREFLERGKTQTVGVDEARLAWETAQALESVGETDLAAEACESFALLLKQREDERTARFAERLEGTARRLRLPGTLLKLTGTTITGETFAWESHRGKVVLVAFWATWSAPCRADIPRLKKTYEQYREHGFEIVGISLDSERQALESFLREQEIPWTILYEENAERGPMAAYYGINSVPTMMLVDRNGRVVSTHVRTEELPQSLGQLLEPAKR